MQSRLAGAVRIEPQWQPVDAHPSDDDVARSLAAGDVEFAVVPSRAWDLLGVDTLKPLQLPGLIVTDAAAAAVSSDPVAQEMLTGLDEVGVTGLALVPEGVRRLFVFPSGTPESFDPRGAGIRTIASKASEELFDLVGATTSVTSGVDLDAQILSGDVSAVDTSWNLLDTLSTGVSAIGDLALFTKFDVIAVNSDWFAGRSADERAGIRAAAEAAAARVVRNMVPDVDQAAAYCAAGGTIGHAAPETARAFADARETLERRWRSEPGAAAVIDRLEQLAADSPPPPPMPFCVAGAVTPTPQSTAPAQVAFPDGVYRLSVSTDELTEAGLTTIEARDHAGIWTLTFRDGSLLMGDMGYDCSGTYVVHGDRVELHLARDAACGGAAGRMLFSARWESDGSTLTFVELRSGESGPGSDHFIQALFQDRPFARIG